MSTLFDKPGMSALFDEPLAIFEVLNSRVKKADHQPPYVFIAKGLAPGERVELKDPQQQEAK